MKLITSIACIIICSNAVAPYPEMTESCSYVGESKLALSDAGYGVLLDENELLEANSRTKTTLGEDHTITLSITGEGPKDHFIGYLVRLGANTDIVDPETVDARDNLFIPLDDMSNSIQMLSCDTGIKDYFVSALSHTSNGPKEFVSFQIRKDDEDELRMEVWMVSDNDDDDWYYDSFDFSFI